MSVTINGDTGIDKVQDGSIVAADLASTLDLSGKTITLATDAAVVSKLSTASGSAPSYSARAWVNFNGTSTVAIRGSGNVTSITDNGTGDYTVNFTTAMSDANYSVVGYGQRADNAIEDLGVQGYNNVYGDAFTTTATRVVCTHASSANQTDPLAVCVVIFR